MSADSGLPTYRGLGGLYENLSTPDGLPIESVRAQVYGGPSVDINPHVSPLSACAELHLPLRAATACEALWLRLNRPRTSRAPAGDA